MSDIDKQIAEILSKPSECIQKGANYPKGYIEGSFDWYVKELSALISTAVREARIEELQLLIGVHDNDPSTNKHGKSIAFARSLLNERLAQLKEVQE